jgi:hypothetical protein
VLLMNLCVPVIDLLTQPRIFGMKDADKEGMSAAKEFTARAWPSARPASCSSSSFSPACSLLPYPGPSRPSKPRPPRKMKLVDEVLPRSEYDNDLLTDTVTLPVTPELGLADPRRSTARKAGQPVALVFEATAPDGYAGKIRLIVAVRANGEVAGVRVTQHKETPGLGDYIEVKDKTRPARGSPNSPACRSPRSATGSGRSRRTAAVSITTPAQPSHRAP